MLPSRIDPCPIIEATVEIRFQPKFPPDAIFGILFNVFKEEYTKVTKLPILQLPEELRDKDPNLIFQPHYHIRNVNNQLIMIGPRSLTISCPTDYVGWESFKKRICYCYDKVIETGIFDNIVRLGIRYINYFKGNIFLNINASLMLGDTPLNQHNTVIKTEIPGDKFKSTVQIANNALVNEDNALVNEESKNLTGSILDIDTYITVKEVDIIHNFKQLLEQGHSEEKTLFFSFLKKEYIQTLNPEYKRGD